MYLSLADSVPLCELQRKKFENVDSQCFEREFIRFITWPVFKFLVRSIYIFQKDNLKCSYDFKNLPSSVCKEASFAFPAVRHWYVPSSLFVFSFISFMLSMLWHSGASEVTMTFTLELPFETFESLFLFGLEWQVAVRLKIPLELTELLSFFRPSRFSVKKKYS